MRVRVRREAIFLPSCRREGAVGYPGEERRREKTGEDGRSAEEAGEGGRRREKSRGGGRRREKTGEDGRRAEDAGAGDGDAGRCRWACKGSLVRGTAE